MTSTGLEERLRTLVHKRPPGIAVAIVDSDGNRFAVGAGRSDLTRDIAASPQMVCPWFSMTNMSRNRVGEACAVVRRGRAVIFRADASGRNLTNCGTCAAIGASRSRVAFFD